MNNDNNVMTNNMQSSLNGQTPNVQPVQPTQSQSFANAQPVPPTQEVNTVDPISVVTNLNKEEAMEEALSHTTQYSPFEVPKQEVNQEAKKTNSKSGYIFIIVIFIIMLLFIIFLPQISKLFGWE